MPPRIAFYTLGCRVNQYETRALMGGLPSDATIVPFGEPADAVVVNTCLVTHKAERETRQVLAKARRANPHALIVATGCYSTLRGESLPQDERVVVVTPEKRKQLLELLRDKLHLTGSAGHSLPPFAPAASRPPLLVQTGCDKCCSYCTIPLARGPSRSRPAQEVLEEFHTLLGRGHGEIVLTGINLGSWRHDGESFASLLALLLDHTPEGRRLRLGSCEPEHVATQVLPLVDHPRLAPHLHIPLQGTCDAVLQEMGRPITVLGFRELLKALLKRRPELAIGADVISGYPTESEGEHEEGVAYLGALPLAYLHVFPYSARPDTPAASHKTLPSHLVKRRAREVRAVAQEKQATFLQSQVNRVVWVAPERYLSSGLCQGMAGPFFPVEFSPPTPLSPLVKVGITGLGPNNLHGEPL